MTDPLAVHVLTTIKGGAGKTEMADVLEAAVTLTGHNCTLVCVDDGNRGLVRRVGKDNAVEMDWTSGFEDAPQWIARHACKEGQHLVFDLGAGLSSSEMPVLALLQTIWRMLYDAGARIYFYCIASTNAPTSSFVARTAAMYGRIGKIFVVRNNQDGSQSFREDLFAGPEPKMDLENQTPGIQAVRLRRRELLSAIILQPEPGFEIATAFMEKRARHIADQLAKFLVIDPTSLERFASSGPVVPSLGWSIRNPADASNERILLNAAVARTERDLRRPDLSDGDILLAAKAYRRARADWQR